MNKSGKVVLVGAGPGDGGLITLRGLHELEQAEVVLFDRLVGPDIIARIPASARRINVGKSSGRHTMPQKEINALILAKAMEGKRVVRLKGGDPYLFGRGAEELEAVMEAGIPFSVIPGVSSALAVPEWAGIPVTHREFASSVHIFTGHPKQGSTREIHYQALKELGGTLIFMMGVALLEEILSGLIQAGMDRGTPAALVENGTLPGQRKLLGTIETLPDLAREATFVPPSVLVVGAVCELSHRLDWMAKLPLAGRCVLVTQPWSNESGLAEQLTRRGCGVLRFPAIRLEPRGLNATGWAMERLTQYQWIVFTSGFGVSLFFKELAERGVDIRSLAEVQFAAVGARTARKLKDHCICSSLVPQEHTGTGLASALLKSVRPGEKLLLYRAEAGADTLPTMLRGGGIDVDDVAAYDTLYTRSDCKELLEKLNSGKVDLLTFTSASAVSGFMGVAGGELAPASHTAICIGKETAGKAAEYGFRVIISEDATMDSMADCVEKYLC